MDKDIMVSPNWENISDTAGERGSLPIMRAAGQA
jgi:hypothetical protein